MAQAPQDVTLGEDFLFNHFYTGAVKKKSGPIVQAPLNFNTLTQQVMFLKDSTVMELTPVTDIDTVYMQGRVFVPAKKTFFERVSDGPVALYIEHKGTLGAAATDIGLGAKSHSARVLNLEELYGRWDVYKLELPDYYKVVSHNYFWLNKSGKFISADNLSKVQNAFPAKAAVIKNYVDNNNIRFNNQDDMVRLISFCNQP